MESGNRAFGALSGIVPACMVQLPVVRGENSDIPIAICRLPNFNPGRALHLVSPFDFSKVRRPPMPSIPVMTTQRRSIFKVGGMGISRIVLYQARRGWIIVA